MDPGMQKLVCEKSPGFVPPKVALSMLIGTFPVLVRTTFCVTLASPWGGLLKARVAGESVAVALTASPLPDKLTVWGLPEALSVNTMEPVRAPVAVGVNSTLTVQVAGGVRNDSVVQLVLVMWKSPLSTTRSKVTGKSPVFVTVIVSVLVVWPTAVSANTSELGVMVRVWAAATPVPVNVKVCGLRAVLSVMVTTPVRVPLAVGVKVTRAPQVAPGFKFCTQPVTE